jgi:hypothetical protein
LLQNAVACMLVLYDFDCADLQKSYIKTASSIEI